MPNRDAGSRIVKVSKARIASDLSLRRLWTVPNLISIGRILLLVPLFIFLKDGARGNGNFWALVVMGIALFTDILDGLIARWFHAESDWGRVLDPLADKTWLGCLALFLAMPWRASPLAWEFLILLLARDLAIVVGAYYAYRETRIVMTSNFLGKVSMGLVALTLIAHTVLTAGPSFAPWASPRNLMFASTIVLILSGLNYAMKLRNILHNFRISSPAPISSVK